MSIPLPDGAPVGVLAGNGTYPGMLASRLAAFGHRVVVAGLAGQFRGDLPDECGPHAVFPIGAFGATSRFFLRHDVRHIFLAGGVNRSDAWRFSRPDRHALGLLTSVLAARDDRLLRAVSQVMRKLGLEVCDPAPYIGELLAGEGLLAGPEPRSAALENIEIARAAALDVGRMDMGQAAIVFRNAVVATEDRRGTDALLTGAPGPGAVLAKMVKPGQDTRFDRPAVGPSTARHAADVGLAAIAVQAGGVLLLERDRLFCICHESKISLIGIAAEGASEGKV